VSPLFPPLPTPGGDSIGDSVTYFKRDLLEYLSAYRHHRLTEWMDIARRHDFSAAKLDISHSYISRSFLFRVLHNILSELFFIPL